MTKTSVLHVSHATNVAPLTQRDRERGLVAASARGEAHLHLSRLAPSAVLALGAFHRQPERQDDVPVWRRHTGGRAVPSGSGFVIISLALPHRSALVSDDAQALAPEQVMNRCVRGVLGALRALGVDVVYPGLDLLTHGRRAFGALSFVEWDDATFFQTLLAVDGSLAETPYLLDRADPEGVVPVEFLSAERATTLASILGDTTTPRLAPAALAGRVAGGYRDAFQIDVQTVDEEVVRALADAYASDPERIPPPEPSGRATRATGLLGPVEAWTEIDPSGRIASFSLTGDFIAPATCPLRLADALRGVPGEPSAIEKAVDDFLHRERSYILGLRPVDLIDLIQRSATIRP